MEHILVELRNELRKFAECQEAAILGPRRSALASIVTTAMQNDTALISFLHLGLLYARLTLGRPRTVPGRVASRLRHLHP